MQGQRSRFRDEPLRASQPGNGHHGVSQWANEQVETQPLASLMTVFAAGFAVGVGAVAAYCAAESQARSRHSDHLTDRIRDVMNRHLPSNLASMWRN